MRRILMLLTVVALIVVMLTMSVAPAFADRPVWFCTDPDGTTFTATPSAAQAIERAGTATCEKVHFTH